MTTFLKVLKAWTRWSAIGVVLVSVALSLLAIADMAMRLGLGYKPRDLVISVAILSTVVVLYGMFRLALRQVKDK